MLVNFHELAEPFSHKREEGLWCDPEHITLLRVCKGQASVPAEEHISEIWGVEISRAFFIKCNDLESAAKFAEELVDLINEAKLGRFRTLESAQKSAMDHFVEKTKDL